MNKQLKEETFEKLWKDKMGDCDYLGSLVSGMLWRMADMIEKDGSMTCTSQMVCSYFEEEKKLYK